MSFAVAPVGRAFLPFLTAMALTSVLSRFGVATPPATDADMARALARSFRHAVDVARPSIVAVRTVERRPESDDAPEAYRSGDATGIVVDGSGGILTSLHGVSGAEVVSVVLADGREFPASEILEDARSDLALVRVEGVSGLSEARFADSSRVDVGDWVIAAGNSFGLGFSANPGTVSATDRELPDARLPLLQSTAPSNPGNSGGPLINLKGEIVGICEGGYSVAGGFDGVTFAIPADAARFVARELIENGSVRWPYVGAGFQTLSPAVAKGLGHAAEQKGAIITRVDTNSPASVAALKVGDVITAFDGRPVRDAPSFVSTIPRSAAGADVPISIVRHGHAATYRLKLGVLPPEDSGEVEQQSGTAPIPEDQNRDAEGARKVVQAVSSHGPAFDDEPIGLTLADLPAEREHDVFPEDLEGVLVRDVKSRSAARYLGVHPGFVVTHVGTEPVRNIVEYQALREPERAVEGAVLLLWCLDCGEYFTALRPDLARLRAREEPRDADD